MTPEALAALHRASFTVPRPWSAAEFAALLAQPGAFLATAPDGFALGRAVAGEAELLTIAVHPAARRRGIARALMADFFAMAKRHDAADIFLEVAADNAAAIALYRAAGFAETGRRRNYYRGPAGGTDALIFHLHLSAET